MTFSQLIYHLLGFFLGIKPCSLNCSILFFSLLNNIRTDLRVTASLYDLG